MAAAVRLVFHPTHAGSPLHFSSPQAVPQALVFPSCATHRFFQQCKFPGYPNLAALCKATPGNDGTASADDGVSLGTMKLPPDIDVARFETLLFQWANSLCQGASLPLPLPLKVDKIPGGARLGFVTLDDGKTEVRVHIDCLVCPAAGGSGPIFRATRNGPLKDRPPPGEPRIMRSLLSALKKSVEAARV
ncbi:uncharacterized protein LOC131159115 isoform X1 [Malania oleifera]|uniref:uncharacterized protein LOC131159115 isoform X1 n=1 Tax=Malania oleifera TaxID=397392 RepID=UPI0025ADA4CE|nr:uncharacterized protein LOC131159115 isoform X1 [Malania oleifera]